MKTRFEFPAMLVSLGLDTSLVEVGTYKGDFAEHILRSWPGHLTCVDAWRHFEDADDILNHDQRTMDECYRFTLERVKPWEHRCSVHRMLSLDAAAMLLEGRKQFDCVYLDASHDGPNVEADLAAWWPLVKAGGIFAGHDYLDGTREQGWPANFGVKSAVDAFAKAHGRTVYTTSDDAFPTWWCIK